MTLVKIDPKEYGLEAKSVVIIEKAFEPKIIERDELAKAEQVKRDNETAKREAILKKEREERERLEEKLRVKEANDQRIKEEAEAKLQAELNMGDAGKFKSLVADLEHLTGKYSFKSKKYQKLGSFVNLSIDKILDEITVW